MLPVIGIEPSDAGDCSIGILVHELLDHAVGSGKISGDEMTGDDSHQWLQNMFWFDLGYIGVYFPTVGLVDHELASTAVCNLNGPEFVLAPYANKCMEGIVWYTKSNVFVGAFLWHIHDREALASARNAIAANQRLSEDEITGAIVSLRVAEQYCVAQTDALD